MRQIYPQDLKSVPSLAEKLQKFCTKSLLSEINRCFSNDNPNATIPGCPVLVWLRLQMGNAIPEGIKRLMYQERVIYEAFEPKNKEDVVTLEYSLHAVLRLRLCAFLGVEPSCNKQPLFNKLLDQITIKYYPSIDRFEFKNLEANNKRHTLSLFFNWLEKVQIKFLKAIPLTQFDIFYDKFKTSGVLTENIFCALLNTHLSDYLKATPFEHHPKMALENKEHSNDILLMLLSDNLNFNKKFRELLRTAPFAMLKPFLMQQIPNILEMFLVKQSTEIKEKVSRYFQCAIDKIDFEAFKKSLQMVETFLNLISKQKDDLSFHKKLCNLIVKIDSSADFENISLDWMLNFFTIFSSQKKSFEFSLNLLPKLFVYFNRLFPEISKDTCPTEFNRYAEMDTKTFNLLFHLVTKKKLIQDSFKLLHEAIGKITRECRWTLLKICSELPKQYQNIFLQSVIDQKSSLNHLNLFRLMLKMECQLEKNDQLPIENFSKFLEKFLALKEMPSENMPAFFSFKVFMEQEFSDQEDYIVAYEKYVISQRTAQITNIGGIDNYLEKIKSITTKAKLSVQYKKQIKEILIAIRKIEKGLKKKTLSELKEQFKILIDSNFQLIDKNMDQFLALIFEISSRTGSSDKPIYPNSLQQAVIIFDCLFGKSNFKEIGTGEGKSLIFRLLTVCRYYKNYSSESAKYINFITSDPILAKRDWENAKFFFDAVDISSGVIDEYSKTTDYIEKAVHFSTPENLANFISSEKNNELLNLNNQPYAKITEKTDILMDEVDQLLTLATPCIVSVSNQKFKFPSEKNAQIELSNIFKLVCYVVDFCKLKEKEKEKGKLFKLNYQIPENILNDMTLFYGTEQQIQNGHALSLSVLWKVLSLYAPGVYLEEDDIFDTLNRWFVAGDASRSLIKTEKFLEQSDAIQKIDTIEELFDLVVVVQNNMPATELKFAGGLHPALVARLLIKAESPGIKNKMNKKYFFPLERDVVATSDIHDLLNQHMNGGGEVIAATGTLDAKSALVWQKRYHAEMIQVPRYYNQEKQDDIGKYKQKEQNETKQTHLTKKGTSFCVAKTETDAQDFQFNTLLNTINSQQPSLFHFETRKRCNDFEDFLSKKLNCKNCTIQIYNAEEMLKDDDGEQLKTLLQKGGQPGVITISNMFGRGIDIKPNHKALEAGGLNSIICDVFSKNAEKQRAGRAGRRGEVGSTQTILAVCDSTQKNPCFIHESDQKAVKYLDDYRKKQSLLDEQNDKFFQLGKQNIYNFINHFLNIKLKHKEIEMPKKIQIMEKLGDNWRAAQSMKLDYLDLGAISQRQIASAILLDFAQKTFNTLKEIDDKLTFSAIVDVVTLHRKESKEIQSVSSDQSQNTQPSPFALSTIKKFQFQSEEKINLNTSFSEYIKAYSMNLRKISIRHATLSDKTNPIAQSVQGEEKKFLHETNDILNTNNFTELLSTYLDENKNQKKRSSDRRREARDLLKKIKKLSQLKKENGEKIQSLLSLVNDALINSIDSDVKKNQWRIFYKRDLGDSDFRGVLFLMKKELMMMMSRIDSKNCISSDVNFIRALSGKLGKYHLFKRSISLHAHNDNDINTPEKFSKFFYNWIFPFSHSLLKSEQKSNKCLNGLLAEFMESTTYAWMNPLLLENGFSNLDQRSQFDILMGKGVNLNKIELPETYKNLSKSFNLNTDQTPIFEKKIKIMLVSLASINAINIKLNNSNNQLSLSYELLDEKFYLKTHSKIKKTFSIEELIQSKKLALRS